MSNISLIGPSEFPVIENNAYGMPLPKVGVRYLFGDSYYGLLFKEAKKEQLPFVFAVMQKLDNRDFPRSSDGLYQAGVVCSVEQVNLEDSSVILFGRYRAKAGNYEKKNNELWFAKSLKPIVDVQEEQFTSENGNLVIKPEYEVSFLGFLFNIRRKFDLLCQRCEQVLGPDNSETKRLKSFRNIFHNRDLSRYDDINKLIWEIIFIIPEINTERKQAFIESTSIVQRIGLCLGLLEWNLKIIQMVKKYEIAKKERRKNSKSANQTQNNKKTMFADDEVEEDLNPELKERIERFKKIRSSIDSNIEKAILEDLNRLKSCYPGQVEWNTFINHLDCLLDLFSLENSPQEKDIVKVESVLEKSHYGLNDVKSKIYDYIATKIRNPYSKAPILCFVGPPGVGKTSIGRSIADALGLKFIRLSLGGIQDEAGIRGHRLTYVGAIPGKIIQEIIRSGSKNPVFMLDEVDKINRDFRGDPSSALLEVLDPEQNHSFQDHYVGAPFDLREVLFLCTANYLAGIQAPLLDRMELVRLPGYTEYEKIQIAKNFIIPKQLIETGLKDTKIIWRNNNPDLVLAKIIKEYTREAGVRDLERQIHQVFSRWGRQVMKKENQFSEILMSEDLIEEYLGIPKFSNQRIKETVIGEAVGLAWTPAGGDILYVQASVLPFTGKELSLTGSQGVEMQEACKVAVSLIRLHLKSAGKPRILDNKTIHIHIPEIAVKKDGPSAGITTFCALYSEVFEIKARPFVAMTGEVNLKGLVTKIGGIKEKVLAAHRDGAKEIIVPLSNKNEVEKEVPDEIKINIMFHFVETVDEVIDIVFKK
jgi:ATP-dependent Lon protease